jgi:hypothetical protein
MLSVGPGTPRFSPSQDIHVKSDLSRRLGNVHYRQTLLYELERAAVILNRMGIPESVGF